MTTLRAAADHFGTTLGAPPLWTPVTTPDPDAPLAIDGTDLQLLAGWFTLVGEALTTQAPEASPTLWPEHFDLAVTVSVASGETTFGGSPGDAEHDQPYLYVLPPSPEPDGDRSFWNEPFGAAVSYDRIATAGDAAAFFADAAARIQSCNATGGSTMTSTTAADQDAPSHDVIVVGGGPAGESVAGRCADHGLSVVLVEKQLVGGECSYWGCIPSKTLIRPGDVVAAARRVPGAAEAVTGPIDVDAALAQRDYMTSDWDDSGQVPWLDEKGITLVRGEGRRRRSAPSKSMSGGGTRRWRRRRPSSWPRARALRRRSGCGSGLADVRPWTTDPITTAKQLPEGSWCSAVAPSGPRWPRRLQTLVRRGHGRRGRRLIRPGGAVRRRGQVVERVPARRTVIHPNSARRGGSSRPTGLAVARP